MILQALTEHYETLVAQGKIERPGWGMSNISYALYINDAGELEQVVSVKTEQVRGKKTVLTPQDMVLPFSRKKSSDITPDFLWDKSSYLLGIGKNTSRALKCFESSKTFHHQLLDGIDQPSAKAVLNFLDRWEPSKAVEHPALQDDWAELTSDVTLVFRYNGAYVHNNLPLQQIWQGFYDNEVGNGMSQVCLVTGKIAPTARTHPPILGAGGTNPKLVSFDKDSTAFCSYGKDQGFNAPVSEYAAFAYATTLNYLIKNRKPASKIGDTTVLFWAKNGQSSYQDLLFGGLLGETSFYSPGEIAGMMDNLLQGKPVSFNETLLDPNMEFYILGLSPNQGRLSVRFFLHNTFGSFLQNVRAHYKRLEILRPANDKFETLPLWKLLDATVNQNSRDKSPSPIMAGETLRAILTDTQYPASLLNGVTLRIRADHQVDRTRAAILKAYYLKRPNPNIPKEVLTVSLNPTCDDPAYVLGRLFSVYEDIQSHANPSIKATIKDKYFNSAASTPATIFSILGNLARNHLKKLRSANMGLCVFYEKQLGEITSLLGPTFPTRMSLPQQGSFQLGYYHQTQSRYQKKEETEHV